MKKIIAMFALSLLVSPAFAAKNCDELKAEIAAKLEAKGVEGYTLEVISSEEINKPEIMASGTSGGTLSPVTGSIQGQNTPDCINCVKNNTLPKHAALKVVGSCEAGTKKITYKKG